MGRKTLPRTLQGTLRMLPRTSPEPVGDAVVQARSFDPGIVDPGIVDAAVSLTLVIQRTGGQYMFDVQRLLSGLGRRVTPEQVVACAVEHNWLGFNGSRATPGDVEPESASSLRYAPVPFGDASYWMVLPHRFGPGPGPPW